MRLITKIAWKEDELTIWNTEVAAIFTLMKRPFLSIVVLPKNFHDIQTLRGTQREYSSKTLNIVFLDVF